MRFGDIKGNEAAVAALRQMADGSRVPHAMLFYENPRSGGLALACAFVQYLNCQNPVNGDSCGECPSCRQMEKLVHPDVHFVFPVNTGGEISGDHPVSEMGMTAFRKLFANDPYFSEQDLYSALGIESKAGNISVFEAKNIVSKLSLTSVSGGYKAIVMFLPERMNIQAANKLLKILEEPPSQTIFLLVSQAPEDVMTTIVSRCQGMRILPFDRSLLVPSAPSEDVVELWKSMLAALIGRNLLEAIECAEAVAGLGSREKQKAFCLYASEQIRKIFLVSKGMADIAYLGGEDLTNEARACSSKFCTRAINNIDKAAMLLSRNVAAKLVFTDLVNRLYINIL